MCAAVALGAAGCACLVWFLVGQGLDRATAWAGVLSFAVAVLSLAVAVPAALPGLRAAVLPRLPAPRPGPERLALVDRPAQVEEAVAALLGSRNGPAAHTAVLYGPGGFGKTTLATLVADDPRIRRRFPGGVHRLTVGLEVRGAAELTAKVNEAIGFFSGQRGDFAEPELAGQKLGTLLDSGPRRLLILDDVWGGRQLAPFVTGGRRCARLVTTRNQGLLAGRGAVLVDEMSAAEARLLLLSGVPGLDPDVADGLLAVTGRWPLLLGLVGTMLANSVQSGADVDAVGALLLEELRERGPEAIDQHSSADAERDKAVKATIDASISRLDPGDEERLEELGVFAGAEKVPAGLIDALWQATAGLGPLDSSQLRARLGKWSLVTLTSGGPGGVSLHDVVRDYLRARLGSRLAPTANRLLGAVAADLRQTQPEPTAEAVPATMRAAWWTMRADHPYLRTHLIELLLTAECRPEAAAVARDLRWVSAQVRDFGPVTAAADLSRLGPPAARLQSLLVRTAHLLTPTEPADAVTDTLCSRLAADTEWGPQTAGLRARRRGPRLVNRHLPPDLPDPALQRVLTIAGELGSSPELTVAPDGSWLAVASGWGAQAWDTVSWQERARVINAHFVLEAALAPDGSWFASAPYKRDVQIWSLETGLLLAAFSGAYRGVSKLTPSPDGRLLITAGYNSTLRVWDTASWEQRATLTRHRYRSPIAMPMRGGWLADRRKDGAIRVLDTSTWEQYLLPAGRNRWGTALAAAPDGSWLAAATDGEAVRVWDPVTGAAQATLNHRHRVTGLTVASDGSWLAAMGGGCVSVWAPGRWEQLAVLTRPASEDWTMAAEGTWLTFRDPYGALLVWDTVTRRERVIRTGRVNSRQRFGVPDRNPLWVSHGNDATLDDGAAPVLGAAADQLLARLATWNDDGYAVPAAAPDDRWLATSGGGAVRIWDPALWRGRTADRNRRAKVTALAAAPDGSWLASAVADEGARDYFSGSTSLDRVQIWDPATMAESRVLPDHGTHFDRGVSELAADADRLTITDHSGRVRAWETASWRELGADGGEIVRIARTSGMPMHDLARQRRRLLPGRWARPPAWANVTPVPNSNWLAVASQSHRRSALIIDASTRQNRTVLGGHRRWVRVTAAVDGSWLATTADGDETVRIWDTASWRLRAVLPDHWRSVLAVSPAPTGGWLITVDGGGLARSWDAQTGRKLMTIADHVRGAAALAMAPGGILLAVGDEDGTVRVWDTASWQLRAQLRVDDAIHACAWLGTSGLAVGGPSGLYVFDYVDDASRVGGRSAADGAQR